MTEQELLLALNRDMKHEQSPLQGLLHVTTRSAGKRQHLTLRPDALTLEPDGITWFEVDRSARGSDRAASLRALVLSMGAKSTLGQPLRRVVVFSRTHRIHQRVLATLDGLVNDSARAGLMEGRRQLKQAELGCMKCTKRWRSSCVTAARVCKTSSRAMSSCKNSPSGCPGSDLTVGVIGRYAAGLMRTTCPTAYHRS